MPHVPARALSHSIYLNARSTDVSVWMVWFLAYVGRAIDGAKTTLASVLTKARFWKGIGRVPLNDRRRRLLNRLMDDFSGRLTASKWAKPAKFSQDTALHDITGLVNHGILVCNPEGGRSTTYDLVHSSQFVPSWVEHTTLCL